MMDPIVYTMTPQQGINLPKELQPENTLDVLEEYKKLDESLYVAKHVIQEHIKGSKDINKEVDQKISDILDELVEEGKIQVEGTIAAGCVPILVYRAR